MSHQRRYRQRRIGALVVLVLLLVVLFLLVRACSGGAEEPAGSQYDPEPEPREETAEESREPERPYAAIPPPPDARPLSETVGPSGEDILELEENAAAGQYQYEGEGGESEPERSVPLGEMLAASAEDASDGPLGENRLVAYYGTPLSDQMGILGEHEPEELMERLKETTARYSAADPERPAVPTIEFIASIAQRDPGADGLYLSRTEPEIIEEYAQLAAEHEALLLLDVQIGRSTVMDEVEALRPFLERPHVHLAIDTEYAVDEGEVPGINLGTVDGTEIQEAIEYLHRLVEENGLPDKVVVVHQFESGIVTSKEEIRPTENVQVVLNADGFGRPEDKVAKYDILVRQEPIQYGGFKLFYRQDEPLLTPEEVLQLDPAPAIVNYQ
jgi:hypothetical protein